MENMAASSFKRSLFALRSSSIGSRRVGSRKVHFCKEGIFSSCGRKHFMGENISGSFGSKFGESGMELQRCIETISGGGCNIIHITLENPNSYYHLLLSRRTSKWRWIHFVQGGKRVSVKLV